ncbi:DUF1127 domain-containing protein [Paracoccus pacificus]|uniref:DUF1127 domain-containing protein n=1 Tax=Paracoccus pacificus TaxID=1463598 RepID=A0ABW4R2B3_9RHOB
MSDFSSYDHAIRPNGLFSRIIAVPARAGSVIIAIAKSYADAVRRMQEIRAFNRLSDKQLAARGLTRQDITRHVYRDHMNA